jgi:hypothetical protein
MKKLEIELSFDELSFLSNAVCAELNRVGNTLLALKLKLLSDSHDLTMNPKMTILLESATVIP